MGSVRFYKQVIILVILVLIVVPTVLAIILFGRYSEQNDVVKEYEDYKIKTQSIQTQQEKEISSLSEQVKELTKDDTLNDSQTTVNYGDPMEYQLSYPEMYVDNKIVANSIEDKTLYLTFDDGPSANTMRVLAILKQLDVKATFFLTYKDTEAAKTIIRAIVADGHSIGVHTASHKYNDIYSSVEAYLADFNTVYKFIYDVTGIQPTLFRFPGGSVNSHNSQIAKQLIGEMLRRGFMYYDWSIDASDSVNAPPKTTIYNNVINATKKQNKGIILMHDSSINKATVEALYSIISDLKNDGYKFLKLSQEVKPYVFSYK